MELLDRMKAGNKAWALYVFSSANAIRQYTMRELVELGVSWIWMGLESPRSGYIKLHGADTLQAHARTARARHQAAGLHHRRTGAPHAREHPAKRSSTPSRTTPISTSSCSTRRCPARRCYAEMIGAGPDAGWRRSGRYPRPAQVQLQARGHLARRVQALSGLGLSPRFRAQRPQPLPHLPHHAEGLAAI